MSKEEKIAYLVSLGISPFIAGSNCTPSPKTSFSNKAVILAKWWVLGLSA